MQFHHRLFYQQQKRRFSSALTWLMLPLWLIATAQAHDIPQLTDAQLSVDYWLARTANPDQILRTPAQISAFNQHILRTVPDMLDLASAPERYSQAEVLKLIRENSQVPAAKRFYADGRPLTAADFARYQTVMALEQLPSQVQGRYALVSSRGSIRTFPTEDRVFSAGAGGAIDTDLDRFQETAVFPGQMLQIVQLSRDRQWAFVRHYHYHGWLQVRHFGWTDKTTALAFSNSTDFLLVTGARIYTSFSAEMPAVSEVALEMGVRLPLLPRPEALVNDQNPAFSHVVQLPTRNTDGSLRLQPALIGRSQDVRRGYLPLTPANIVRQAFKFLGERYGWGHDFAARDCSGFVGEVFKSFGLLLPRNTGSLGKYPFGAAQGLQNSSDMVKTAALAQAQTGDLILIPGHVMLVLGRATPDARAMSREAAFSGDAASGGDGDLFVIHAANGLSYYQPDGQYYHSKLNGVSITPFLPLQLNRDTSYLQAITQIKSLTRDMYAHP